MRVHIGIKKYFGRLISFLLALSFLRLLFLLLNKKAFSTSNLSDYFWSFIWGIYFDFIYVFYALIPVFILLVFLTPLFKFKWVQIFESVYFISIVLITTVLTCIDMAYYPFVKSHVGADLLFFMDGENNISLWTYIFQYWYLFLICLIVPFLTWLGLKVVKASKPYPWLGLIPRVLLFVALIFVVRGGNRLRPITSLDAVLFAPQNMDALVACPAFVFVESFSNNSELEYSPEIDITDIQKSNWKNYSSDEHQLKKEYFDSLNKPNFIIIILESFGKEFTSLNTVGAPSYTPFLDSLMGESINFTSAFANGQKSKDAIPAIFTGIPALVKNGFILSKYSKNKLPSSLNSLKQLGYSTAFFHGANNGTMGFRNYLLSNGLTQYFGIDEYENKERDFDGHWGIFDEPYFHYFKKKLGEMPQPFMSSIFTLSSHDPYAIPDQYQDIIPKEKVKLHRSVRYTDLSLKSFFESVKKEPWFQNTVFIITADHSSLNDAYQYQVGSGKYEIPFMIYSPLAQKNGLISKSVQHIDIVPSILDLVQYPDSIQLFGESVFSNTSSPLLFKDGDSYIYRKDEFELKVVNNQTINLYDLENDPARYNDILDQKRQLADQMLEELIKQKSNFAEKMIFNHFF